jgi:hypothetical protein
MRCFHHDEAVGYVHFDDTKARAVESMARMPEMARGIHCCLISLHFLLN